MATIHEVIGMAQVLADEIDGARVASVAMSPEVAALVEQIRQSSAEAVARIAEAGL